MRIISSNAVLTHANSHLSTVSNEPIHTETVDDYQLFFVTSYSKFDKLGTFLAIGHRKLRHNDFLTLVLIHRLFFFRQLMVHEELKPVILFMCIASIPPMDLSVYSTLPVMLRQ
jgi:hypothetical protein